MFRSNGRPRTAVNVICNLAWASSLGGLCLLAEERRRRVIVAQKIIENGKKLQAYKAYTAAAAVVAFDLGEEWDSDLPNLHETPSFTPPGNTLTNNEWRSRNRTHRVIPTATPLPSVGNNDMPWRANIFVNHTLPLVRDVSSHTPAVVPHNKSPTLTRPEIAPSESIHDVASRNKDKVQSSSQAPNAVQNHPPHLQSAVRDRHRYALRMQEIIANRAIECLHSDNMNVRSYGYQELSTYLENFEKHSSPLIAKALSMALSIQEPYDVNNLALKARQHLAKSLQTAPQIHRQKSHLTLLKSFDSQVRYSLVSANRSDVSEAPFARKIQKCLDAQQLDDAFYWFLALCEKSSEPISRATRRLIRELTFAYKSLGLYSVVMEIQEKTLHILKEWRLLYADMAWLMDHAAPKNNAKFCMDAVGAFMQFDPMGKDSRLNLSLRFLHWFVENNEPEQGIDLFTKIFRPGYVECDPHELKDLAQDLYQKAVTAELFESAENILSWFTKQGIVFSGTLKGYEVIFEKLTSHGKDEHAADLYLALRECHEQDSDTIELLETIKHFVPGFEDLLYQRCDQLVSGLYQRRQYNAILGLSHILHDHSRLRPSTTVLFYHTFSMIGSLAHAKRVVTELANASIPLWQDIVHDSHSILLDRCWKMTRNFQLTEELFSSIRALGFHRARSVRTYNSMILACVQDGRMDAAQHYMDELVDGARLRPDIVTWSHFMLGKALSGDWDGVSNVLKQAQASGALPERGGYDGSFFNQVFVEFCKQHNAKEITEFAINLTQPHFLTITKSMSNQVIDAVVKTEELELLGRWVYHVHSRGLMPSLGKEPVARVLDRIMQSKRLKFHPTLSDAHHLQAAAGNPDVSEVLDTLNAINTQQGPKNSSLEQRSRYTEPKLREPRRTTERAMLNALSKGAPLQALRLYSESLVHGLPRQQVDLELAVRAALTLNPESTTEASGLINDAELAGLNVERCKTPFLMHDLERRALTEDEAHDIAFNFYRKVDQPGNRLHHHTTIAVVRNLHINGNTAAGLRLLRAVHESEWGLRKPFDLAVLTMTLRLVLKAGHMDGAEWVINTVLQQNLRIDQTFLRTLQNELQRCRRKAQSSNNVSSDENDQNVRWTTVLTAHIAMIRARREQQRDSTLNFAKQAVKLFRVNGQEGPRSDDANITALDTAAVDASPHPGKARINDV